jgi:hypothetical protein
VIERYARQYEQLQCDWMLNAMISLPSEGDLRQLLEEVARDTNVPGVAAVVSVKGERSSAYVGQAVQGRLEPLCSTSRFEVSCQMKFFQSLVALDLAFMGSLTLDAPVHEYLPELKRAGNSSTILVRHLLSHTSGYRGLDISDFRTRWSMNWQRFTQHFHRHEASFTPGCVFNYEHSEHVVLGEIISRIRGMSAVQVVQRELLQPLGIEPGCAVSDTRIPNVYVGQHRLDRSTKRYVPISLPAFSPFWSASLPNMTMSLSDHVCVAETVLESLHGTSAAQRFSKSALHALLEPAISLPKAVATGIAGERLPSAFSLACGHYRLDLYGHNGSMAGQACAIRLNPKHRLALAVGINAWSPYARDATIDRVVALCLRGTPSLKPPRNRRTKFTIDELVAGYPLSDLPGSYVGSYHGRIMVTKVRDGLHFALGASEKGGETAVVRSRSDGLYELKSSFPVSIGFFPDPAADSPALMVGLHAYKKETSEARARPSP